MVVILSLLMAGCGGEEPVNPPPVDHPEDAVEEEVDFGGPDPVAQLFRASLDLRGVRPTLDEIDQIDADPDAYEAMVAGFLDDERFVDRVVNLYAEVFLTRNDGDGKFADPMGSVDATELCQIHLFARPVYRKVVGDPLPVHAVPIVFADQGEQVAFFEAIYLKLGSPGIGGICGHLLDPQVDIWHL